MAHGKESTTVEFDYKEFAKRVFRVLVNGLAVALAAFLIPEPQLPIQDVLMIAIAAAAVLAVIDLICPCIGSCYSDRCRMDKKSS